MFDDETIEYHVVMNDEEQYSIWPAHRTLPDGWQAIGPARTREQCLDHIERVWTDMRPKSVREAASPGLVISPGQEPASPEPASTEVKA